MRSGISCMSYSSQELTKLCSDFEMNIKQADLLKRIFLSTIKHARACVEVEEEQIE